MSVIFERSTPSICRILLNSPAKRNAIDKNIYTQLREALGSFERDDKLRVAVLAGLHGNFCSGYDLNSIVDIQTGKPRQQAIRELLWPLEFRLSDKKITIAAIEGHAVGFGFELALKCSFIVADRDARLGFLNRRFGIPIMNGGTVMLPQLVGFGRAAELVATGRAQLAQEAYQFGLVHYVSSVGCCLGRAENLARSLAKFDHAPLMSDIDSIYSVMGKESLQKERDRAIAYLDQCQPLETAVKFLKGELCRHGSTDLGTSGIPFEPEPTL